MKESSNVPAALAAGPVSCQTCPYVWPAPDGNHYCRRYPPISATINIPIAALPKEQQLRLPPEVARAGHVQAEQSKFPAVQVNMVCGEHPDFDIGDEEESTVQ